MSPDPAAPTKAATLTGTVHSAAAAVPDAVVTLTDAYGTQVARTRSDAAGRFGFAEVPGRCVVVAHRPGYRPGAASAAEGAVVDLLLEPIAVLHGAVRDAESGRPVAAATVVAVEAGGEVVARTISDPDGRYRLEGLPEADSGAALTVVASAPGVPPAARTALPGGEPVDLELATLGTLTGRAPVGLTLFLVAPDGRKVATTTADEHGEYAFADVVPGEYTLVSAAPPPTTAAVGATATTCDLTR
jgi:hypothetical protein